MEPRPDLATIRLMLRPIALALCLSALAACRSAPPARPAAPIQHVVLVWLKEPGDAEARRALIEAGRGLASIPEVLDVRVGEPLASERDVVDDSFDVGMVMSFATPAGLDAYDAHPDHVRAVREVLEPLAARVVVYDILARE